MKLTISLWFIAPNLILAVAERRRSSDSGAQATTSSRGGEPARSGETASNDGVLKVVHGDKEEIDALRPLNAGRLPAL
jgi:hypothetical protein